MNQENQDFTPEGGQSQETSPLQEKLRQALEKFRELPPKTQMIILGGLFVFVVLIFSGGDKPQQQAAQQQAAQQKAAQIRPNTTDARVVNKEDETNFQLLDDQRGSLQRGFFEEQRRIISERLGAVEEQVDSKMDEVKEIQSSIAQQAKQLNQMIENFNEQMKSMEKVNKGSLEEIRKLAEESKNRSMQAPAQGGGFGAPGSSAQGGGAYGSMPESGRKKPIKQIILQQDSSAAGTQGNPLLGGLVQPGPGVTALQQQLEEESAAPPFIPPLGFVRGTLLNGFDALAGAGTPTPALVRLSGTYKTAMNSTVNLNGCFMLIEFEGDISTERAFGTPARMTCVYPDQGAMAYDVAGYVVDEKDGIVGIPGIFYEGDPSRLAAAAIAEFTASIASIVRENQNTETTSADGVQQSAITGSETKAQIAGGIADATSSLSEYLTERANRIVPFVRVDSTRDLHIVILEGVELRHQGQPWTLLVSGETVDKMDAARKQKLQQLQQVQERNNVRRVN